jgi:hypothetical protein
MATPDAGHVPHPTWAGSCGQYPAGFRLLLHPDERWTLNTASDQLVVTAHLTRPELEELQELIGRALTETLPF